MTSKFEPLLLTRDLWAQVCQSLLPWQTSCSLAATSSLRSVVAASLCAKSILTRANQYYPPNEVIFIFPFKSTNSRDLLVCKELYAPVENAISTHKLIIKHCLVHCSADFKPQNGSHSVAVAIYYHYRKNLINTITDWCSICDSNIPPQQQIP